MNGSRLHPCRKSPIQAQQSHMKEIPDIERLEREYADTLMCLGLIGPEGDVVAGVERFLAEIANGDDRHRSSLAKHAIEIMDTLDRALHDGDTAGEATNSRRNTNVILSLGKRGCRD